ncbi:MAG: ComF family protein [Phormidesmis sp.]
MGRRAHLQQLSHSLIKASRHTVKRSFNHAGTQALLRIFLAQRCPVCARTTSTPFCTDCQRQIDSVCYPVKGWQLSATDSIAIGALGEYRGTLKQAILALKYKNCPEVARSLGAALAQRWQAQVPMKQTNIYAVPIPLHPNRLAQRGYNQAALIAEGFCRVSGLPVLSHGLVRAEDTLPQHQLGVEDRQSNLESAFTIGKALQNVHRRAKTPPKILLIDDIYTTGTTAQSAAQTLATAGLQVIGMLALARAMSN